MSLLSNFIKTFLPVAKQAAASAPQPSIRPSSVMSTSNAGIAILKQFEGCRLASYQDDRGIWTIGFGHTGPEVVKGVQISQAQAEDLLKINLASFEETVNKYTTLRPNQNQFDAMICLTYNIGSGAFSSSTVLRKFNVGDNQGAADAFLMWNKEKIAGVVRENKGLTNRRKAECELFLKA